MPRQLFSKRIDRKIRGVILFAVLTSLLALGGLYYNTFRQTEYCPVQPVQFSHATHAGKLGMDCQACHHVTALSLKSGIPDSQSCLECHRHIKRDSPLITPLLSAADPEFDGYTGDPVQWIKVNRIAEHVNFSHQAHVTRGVGCSECHGEVSSMESITVPQNRGMRWCMDCHRKPEKHLRPLDAITDSRYNAEDWLKDHGKNAFPSRNIADHSQLGGELRKSWNINPKTDCSSCHQ